MDFTSRSTSDNDGLGCHVDAVDPVSQISKASVCLREFQSRTERVVREGQFLLEAVDIKHLRHTRSPSTRS